MLDESRKILTLAWPIVLTHMNWTIMHMVDVMIVGWAGTGELAALAAARVLSFVAIVMGMAGLTGVLVFTSRADGAGEVHETGHIFRQGIFLGVIAGLIMGVLFFAFARPFLAATGVAADLVAPGADVLRAMAIGFPAQLLLAAATYFLEGVSQPRRVMAVNLIMLPVNALLAWALTGGHFGLPAMGAVGAALATSMVSWGGAIMMIMMAWTLPEALARNVRDLSVRSWKAAAKAAPALLSFGFAPAISSSLELAGFAYLIALSTQLGNVTAAAFQVVFSLHNAGFALALGLSSAAGVRVGNMVGANRREEILPISIIASILSVIIMGVPVLLYLLVPGGVVSIFTEDVAVSKIATTMVFLIAPFILFDGLQAVFVAALRSLGDQVRAGLNGVVGFFIIMGSAGYWLVSLGFGGRGLVYAIGAGMIATALLQGYRLFSVTRR